MAATGPASDGADASLEVELREDADRFVAAAAPDNAYLEFVMEQDGAVMNMTHTWTAPAARGNGFAGKITLFAFQHCRANNLRRQQVGDLVFLRPGGNVHWDPVTDPALSLMLAGGIGITPFLSMCSRLQNNVNKTTSRISLVHSSRRHFSNSSDSTLVDWPEKELNALTSPHLFVDRVYTDGTGTGRIGKRFVRAATEILVGDFDFAEDDLRIEKWW
eukprot:g3896.t1